MSSLLLLHGSVFLLTLHSGFTATTLAVDFCGTRTRPAAGPGVDGPGVDGPGVPGVDVDAVLLVGFLPAVCAEAVVF